MEYYYPTSLEELRNGTERTIDRGATAFKVDELMDTLGSGDWLSPLMDELGPFIQVQVEDLANRFKAAYNFYHSHSPPHRPPPPLFPYLKLYSSIAHFRTPGSH